MDCYILPNVIALRGIHHSLNIYTRHIVTYTVLLHTSRPARIYRDAARRYNTP